MSLSTAEDESASKIHTPCDIDWQMRDKSKFFFLGAPPFSGVSGILYPLAVLKTRQQVMVNNVSYSKMAASIFRTEGYRGFYRGLGTTLVGVMAANAIYMPTFTVIKSIVGNADAAQLTERLASVIPNDVAILYAAMAAQLVWTPIDVVSQRLMVQGGGGGACTIGLSKYGGGIDAFRKIMNVDGVRGLYRGFGISLLTNAPLNFVWWASYPIAYMSIWGGLGCYFPKNENGSGDRKAVMAVSAVMASGVSAVLTMPFDIVKTRMQVLDVRGRSPTFEETVRNLAKEGGLGVNFRGFGARWASMSLSTTTVITTQEYLKRLSTKMEESFDKI